MATQQPSQEFLNEYNGDGLVAFASVFIAVQIIAIVARFIARGLSKTPFGADDWLVVPGLICGVAVAAISIVMVQYGGAGYHLIRVYSEDPTKVVVFAKLVISFAIFYLLGMTFPKLAMLCMFLRIFVSPVQRGITYILMFVLCATAVADIIANYLQCIPLSHLWDPTGDGYCFNQNAYWRWGTFPNIVTDVFMIFLPIPTVLKIQLSWKDKIGVLLTFLVGGVGLIASILRFAAFYSVNGVGPTADSTWETSKEAIYSILEISVYLVTCSLPAYRAFYLRVRRSRTAIGGSSRGYGTGQSWRRKNTAVSSSDDDGQIPLSRPYGNFATSNFQKLDNESDKTDNVVPVKTYDGSRNGIQVRSEYEVEVSTQGRAV